MNPPRHSTHTIVAGLFLTLILLVAGLVVLAFPNPQIPELGFILAIGQEYRLAIAAGVIGLLLLLIVSLLSRRLRGRREARKAGASPGKLAMAYRRKLITELRQLKVMDVSRPFDLETSCIPLRVGERPRLHFEGNKVTALTTRGEITSPQEALGRFHHLALLGKPGAGKTTLLRYLALQAAQNRLKGLPDFPILISLPHFAASASQSSLLDFITREIDARHGSPGLCPDGSTDSLPRPAEGMRSYLEERLEEGSVLLLLDGLDETSVGRPRQAEVTYRRVVGQINVLTARYPNTPIVVTSRLAGWKGLLAASFHTLEILKLGQDDVHRFIENWFGRASDQARDLSKAALRNPQTRALATNPLSLSLVALVFEQDRELPEDRAGLYRRGMELLLEEWETHHSRKRVSRFTAIHQRDLLEEVALHFHLQRHLCFPKDELSGIIASCLSAMGLPAARAPSVLKEVSAQHGLLKEQAPGWYSFPHPTWQEYFAAMTISKRNQLELVLEDVSAPWWEGTILFLSSSLLLEDATPLLESILGQEEDIFRSNLLLAGRCLAGEPRIGRSGLRESIIEQLQELVEGEYHLPLRRRAIGVLEEIGDSSITAYFLSLVTVSKIDRTVHHWITKALASLGDESTVSNLAALLPDQEMDLVVRTNVAAALASLGDQSLVPQFLALLPDEEVDYRVRMAVAEALGALGDESVISRLLRLLPNEKIDYRVRVRLAEVLGALGDESITPQLLRLLPNEKVDYNVRMTVAEALGSLGDKSIASQLLAILVKKKVDPDVRASIAAALGPLGDRSVVPQLLLLLPDEKIDPSIRWRIVEALGSLGAMDDEGTVPDLLGLLADDNIDASVRVTMAEAVGEMTVTPRLPDPIPTGKEAAKALSSLGDRSKVPQLLVLLSDRELGRSIRLKIVEALGSLGDDRITAEGLTALLDDEEIGSEVYQALFLVSQRIGVRVFARERGGYEIR